MTDNSVKPIDKVEIDENHSDDTIYSPWSAKSREHITLVAHALADPWFERY